MTYVGTLLARSDYAEDELSDEADNCPDGPVPRIGDVEQSGNDVGQPAMEHSGSAERRTSQRRLRAGHSLDGVCLFDEDELSDDESPSGRSDVVG